MTKYQSQTCNSTKNNIRGSIQHKLWGGWRRSRRWWWWWWWCWWRCWWRCLLWSQGGVGMSMASLSPSPEAPVQQDLPSPRVGEDFRLRRRLNKSRKKYGLGFLAKRSVWDKSGAETMSEVRMSVGGAARKLGRATCARLHLVALLAYFFRSRPSFGWKTDQVIFPRIFAIQKTLKQIKYEKGGFLPPRN